MTSIEFRLLTGFEVHSEKKIRAIRDAGFDVQAPITGRSVVNSLDANITRLLEASGRRVPPLANLPKRYLTS